MDLGISLAQGFSQVWMSYTPENGFPVHSITFAKHAAALQHSSSGISFLSLSCLSICSLALMNVTSYTAVITVCLMTFRVIAPSNVIARLTSFASSSFTFS